MFYYFNHSLWVSAIRLSYIVKMTDVFPIQINCTGTQIWPCRKKVKGQIRVIIRINLVDLESTMLYAMIQPWSFLGSGAEVSTIYGHGGPWPLTNLQFPFNRKLHMKFKENRPRGYKGEVQRCGRVDGWTDGRTDDGHRRALSQWLIWAHAQVS